MTYTIMHRHKHTSKVGRGAFKYPSKIFAEEIKKTMDKINIEDTILWVQRFWGNHEHKNKQSLILFEFLFIDHFPCENYHNF